MPKEVAKRSCQKKLPKYALLNIMYGKKMHGEIKWEINGTSRNKINWDWLSALSKSPDWAHYLAAQSQSTI